MRVIHRQKIIMIIKLGQGKALWLGYELDRCKILSFEEGVKMLMEAAGYAWEQVEAQFDVVSPDYYMGGLARLSNPPQTKASFLKMARHYLEAFDAPNRWKTENMSLLEARGGVDSDWENQARGFANPLFKYCATK